MYFYDFSKFKNWLDSTYRHCRTTSGCTATSILTFFKQEERLASLIDMLSNDQRALEQISARSVSYANSFDKIVLHASSDPNYRLNLHIWWPMEQQVVDLDEGMRIHDYGCSFEALMLCGSLRLQHFEHCPTAASGLWMYGYKSAVRDNTASTSVSYAGQVSLKCTFDAQVSAGNIFMLDHSVRHRIVPSRQQITSTLILRDGDEKPLVDLYSDMPIDEYEHLDVRPISATELTLKLENLYQNLYRKEEEPVEWFDKVLA